MEEKMCSFWQRQQFRMVDDEGFGIRVTSLMTEEQIERQDIAREAEDEADPMCGRCEACAGHAEAMADEPPDWWAGESSAYGERTLDHLESRSQEVQLHRRLGRSP